MNLLIEIGNTALKAAWSDGMTLGKTFRYQGEKVFDYIDTLLEKEKPEVMVVSSSVDIDEIQEENFKRQCGKLIILDRTHTETATSEGFPKYLSPDRSSARASIGCGVLPRSRTSTDSRAWVCRPNSSMMRCPTTRTLSPEDAWTWIPSGHSTDTLHESLHMAIAHGMAASTVPVTQNGFCSAWSAWVSFEKSAMFVTQLRSTGVATDAMASESEITEAMKLMI